MDKKSKLKLLNSYANFEAEQKQVRIQNQTGTHKFNFFRSIIQKVFPSNKRCKTCLLWVQSDLGDKATCKYYEVVTFPDFKCKLWVKK